MKGLGYGLDENALTALKDWRFSPAVRNGERVSVIAEIEIPFSQHDLARLLAADLSEHLQKMLQAVEKKQHDQLMQRAPQK